MPDEGVGDFHVIELGGVRLELHYTGRNHSDNSLVMILPKDKLAFTVDFVSVESVGFRDFPDGYFPDWVESLDRVIALDWDRMIGGHPFPGGRYATKDDVRNSKQFLVDLNEAVRVAASQGKCWDTAMTEVKLPKYEKWANYERGLPQNIEKFCNFWSRGYWQAATIRLASSRPSENTVPRSAYSAATASSRSSPTPPPRAARTPRCAGSGSPCTDPPPRGDLSLEAFGMRGIGRLQNFGALMPERGSGAQVHRRRPRLCLTGSIAPIVRR